MNKPLKSFVYLLATGFLATVSMDVAALLAVKLRLVDLGQYRIVPTLLGRWVGWFPSGKFVHANILETAPFPYENLIGLGAHYGIGLTLSLLFLFPHLRMQQPRVSAWSALSFGIATCALPYLLMFPAMGFGVMALKLAQARTLIAFSVVNHTVFGLGLFLWSHLLAKLLLRSNPSTCSFGGPSKLMADPLRYS